MSYRDVPLGLVPARFRMTPAARRGAEREGRRTAAPEPEADAALDPPFDPPPPGSPPEFPSKEPAPIDLAPAAAEKAGAAPAGPRWRGCAAPTCRRRRRCLGRCGGSGHDQAVLAHIYKTLTWRLGGGPQPEPLPWEATPAAEPPREPRRKRPSVRRRRG